MTIALLVLASLLAIVGVLAILMVLASARAERRAWQSTRFATLHNVSQE